jgi:hypothetical protein
MFREDYIIRLIRQFAEALARIARLRVEGKLSDARAAIDNLHDELFGLPRAMTDRVDTPTLAALLKDADKMRAAAMLYWEEGRLYKATGDPLTAHLRYRRAHELMLEARALAPAPDDDAAILELSRAAPARDLDPRYRGEV